MTEMVKSIVVGDGSKVWRVEPWIVKRSIKAFPDNIGRQQKFILRELKVFKKTPEVFGDVVSFVLFARREEPKQIDSQHAELGD